MIQVLLIIAALRKKRERKMSQLIRTAQNSSRFGQSRLRFSVELPKEHDKLVVRPVEGLKVSFNLKLLMEHIYLNCRELNKLQILSICSSRILNISRVKLILSLAPLPISKRARPCGTWKSGI